MNGPVAVYDFTIWCDKVSFEDVKKWCKEWGKKWTFQQEQAPTTLNRHYQGRISLKNKVRFDGMINILNKLGVGVGHISITSEANRKNDFYVTKEDSRIEGPWKDTDVEIFIPWDVELMKELRPWQYKIVSWCPVRELRRVKIILDLNGGIGKTSLIRWIMCHKLGQILPFCNDYKDMLRMVMDMPKANLYLVDMPRAISKERLNQLWSAIETIKGGYAYDDRYHFRQECFNPPQMVVFTNEMPDTKMLSHDRWEIYQVNPTTMDLVLFGE